MIKKCLAILLFLPVILISQTQEKKDNWKPLRFLEGSWEAVKPGVSHITQDYSFVLNGKFMHMKTKGVFEPTKKKPKGEVHEDFAIFSYDSGRKKIIMRGFYVEGFVNRYVLDISADGKTLTFVTDYIENAPPGTRGKLEFKVTGKDTFEQSFFVAWPKKEYNCFFTNKYKRKK